MAGTGKERTPRQRAFGERVRTRRKDLGLSQEEFAVGSGLHRTYVWSLEAGIRNPSLDTICRVALTLDIDAGELVRELQALPGRG